MDAPEPSVFTAADRSGWRRLRTLILLRWLMVCGQAAAVALAWLGLGLDLHVLACAAVIGAAAAFNLVAMRISPAHRILTEREATLTLLADLLQLTLLLCLTGGLANPFAWLIVAPATIGASALSLRATVLLGVASTAMISAIALVDLPLRLDSGAGLARPWGLTVGTWAALVLGVVVLAIYARRVTGETVRMTQALAATQTALARGRRLTMLSGMAAAAAHEFGTPLATIKLASTELAEALGDRPDLREDALLIRAQADRCRDILRVMDSRGDGDAQARSAPLSSVVEEAAAPHVNRGRRIITRIEGAAGTEGPADQPAIERRPEIVLGLRNLLQNAVDFARSTVWIDMDWTPDAVRVAIGDDGPGYPPDLIGRIGDPFLLRNGDQDVRPGYEGMGLGLFIAKTLLERSGAALSFGNGSDLPGAAAPAGPPELSRPTGAVVAVVWPRDAARSPYVGDAPT